MDTPVRAANGPFEIVVKEGKNYFWCACGRSQAQPFCDGSHKGSGFSPVIHKAKASETLYFCGCKQTKTQPLCDGSHQK